MGKYRKVSDCESWATVNAEDTKRIIAVLDDDIAVRESLEFSLELEGFTIRIAASAEELDEHVRREKFDCLIVDYHLPGTNGLDVLAALRDKSIAPPAILITGNPNDHIRKRAAADGAVLIEKPFAIDALVRQIHVLLDQ